MISALKTKRLLHKGCEAYLAYVVDKSTPKVALDSVLVVQEFQDVFLENLLSVSQSESESLELNCYRVQLSSLYHHIGWRQLN